MKDTIGSHIHTYFAVVAHAVWSIDGFLNAFKANRLFGSGMVDFAGAGVVHVSFGFGKGRVSLIACQARLFLVI